MKLPRLPVDWMSQPELVRRYWDKGMSAIEAETPQTYTVTTLPGVGPQGLKAFVTDATSVSFWSIPSGGGSNFAPVTFDGVDWRIS